MYTQCQWFLQGLPGTFLAEIFYRHDTNLEDDDGINFKDLLKKALILIKCRKRLADFIEEEESDWKFTNHRKNQPTAQVNHHSIPPIIFPPISSSPDIVEPITYITQGLTPNNQAIQGSIQVSVARVQISGGKEVKVDELILDADNCILVSDPIKNLYEDLGALFIKLKPEDEVVYICASAPCISLILKSISGCGDLARRCRSPSPAVFAIPVAELLQTGGPASQRQEAPPICATRSRSERVGQIGN